MRYLWAVEVYITTCTVSQNETWNLTSYKNRLGMEYVPLTGRERINHI